jgi:AraC-like DNA-binding protein
MSTKISVERTVFFSRITNSASLLNLFDYLPDVFLYVKDAQGRFMKMNRTFLLARGVANEEEILGKTDLDIHPRYWGQRYRDEDQKVMRSKTPLVDQVWLIPDVNGVLEPFVSTKIPLFDQAGTCIGIAGIRSPLNPIESSSNGPGTGIHAAIRIMNERFATTLEMSQLSEIAGLSHSQFNRRFKSLYKMSPSNYLQRVRVHEACRRLVSSNQAASEIALEAGFYDQAHMTRTFKKTLGVTPIEFRKMN